MKKLGMILSAAAALSLFSCKPDEIKEPADNGGKDNEIEITVDADRLLSEWKQEDSLTLFDNLGDHVFRTSMSGPSAKFTGESYVRALSRALLYPRTGGVVYADNRMTVPAVPAVQRGFQPVSVSFSQTKTFKMQSVVAALEFTVTSSDVEYVTIEDMSGGALAGDVAVEISSAGQIGATPVGKGSKITLLPEEGQTSLPAGTLRVSCLPGSFEGGLFVTAVRAGDRAVEKETGPLNLQKGAVTSIGVIEDGTLPELAPVDIRMSFMTDAETPAFQWPFVSPSSNISSSWGTATYANQEVEYTLPESEGGYVFKIFCTNGVCKNTIQGFRFGGAAGAYIEFPELRGLYLTSVTMVSGNANSSLIVQGADGSSVLGGDVTASFGAAGDTYTWDIYEATRSKVYRLITGSDSAIGLRHLYLHYDLTPRSVPTGPVRILDYGLAEAKTGEERFNILKKAHTDAVSFGRDVDYSGVGRVDLEIPANASTIPLRENTDFKGAVFHVVNTSKKLYLFTLSLARKPVKVTGAQIDAADYSAVPELRSGLHLLLVQDDSLWVYRREGHDYGATRKEAVLVRDGEGSNGPCAPYNTPASRINATYCDATDDLKTFANVTLDRDKASTFMTHLVKFESLNNIKLSNITINTPQDNDWVGDACISITSCTNILCEDITINGTYSQTDYYGYGISLNGITNATFRRLHSACRWGVFGSNNTHNSLLEDSDTERYDTHCYGRNITVRNSTLTGRGIPVSSIFGTIRLEDTKLVRCYPYQIRADYNSYVGLDVVIKNCEMSGTSAWIFPMGRLDALINDRPELAKKRWPNVTIDGLKFQVPSSATAVYLFRPTTKNTYPEKLGYISNISISGLELIYPSGKSTVPFYLSSQAANTDSNLSVTFDGCKMASPSGSSPAKVYLNLKGPKDTHSTMSSDIEFVE